MFSSMRLTLSTLLSPKAFCNRITKDVPAVFGMCTIRIGRARLKVVFIRHSLNSMSIILTIRQTTAATSVPALFQTYQNPPWVTVKVKDHIHPFFINNLWKARRPAPPPTTCDRTVDPVPNEPPQPTRSKHL